MSTDIVHDGRLPGFAEMGMPASTLETLEDIAPRYLIRFRQMSAFVDDEGGLVKQPSR